MIRDLIREAYIFWLAWKLRRLIDRCFELNEVKRMTNEDLIRAVNSRSAQQVERERERMERKRQAA